MSKLVLTLMLAASFGFASHRARLCTVNAVAEWLRDGRSPLLLAFVKASLWAMMITLPVFWMTSHNDPSLVLTQPLWLALLGGLFFGIGAAINHGCAFSTLYQLVEGKLGMLGTLLGFCAGVAAAFWLSTEPSLSAAPLLEMPGLGSPVAAVMILLVWIWGGWELFRLWRSRDRNIPWWRLPLSKYYRPASSAAVVGLCGGTLYALEGAWTYTNTLKEAVLQLFLADIRPTWFQGEVFLAIFFGMLMSARQGGQSRLRFGTLSSWLMHGAGGFLMGVGTVLIPGGNETLLFQTIPSLTIRAPLVFLALLVGVALPMLLGRHKPFRAAYRPER